MPSAVARHGDHLGLVGREGLQRAEVGGRLHRDAAAGINQHLADEVEPLLRAGGDEHLLRVDRHALFGQVRCDPFAQRRIAFAGGVLQRLARGVAQHAGGGFAHRFDREGVGRGQAAGQRDDAGALGDLQDLADH
jgi:hypothetical protein